MVGIYAWTNYRKKKKSRTSEEALLKQKDSADTFTGSQQCKKQDQDQQVKPLKGIGTKLQWD